MLNETSGKWLNFKKELEDLISKHGVEGLYEGNVPDFILSQVACSALVNFMLLHNSVKDWYGVHLEPGGKSCFMGFREDVPVCSNCAKEDDRVTKHMFVRLIHDVKNQMVKIAKSNYPDIDKSVIESIIGCCARDVMWDVLKPLHGKDGGEL